MVVATWHGSLEDDPIKGVYCEVLTQIDSYKEE
jgi:hypothetical protein